MPVIGDLRIKEFRGQEVLFGEIVPGYCYRLRLSSTIPDCRTDRVIKIRKSDAQKLKKMKTWERHKILKRLVSHPMPLHKREVVKI